MSKEENLEAFKEFNSSTMLNELITDSRIDLKFFIDNDGKFNDAAVTQNYEVKGENFKLEVAGKKLSEVWLTFAKRHPDINLQINGKNAVDYIKEIKPRIRPYTISSPSLSNVASRVSSWKTNISANLESEVANHPGLLKHLIDNKVAFNSQAERPRKWNEQGEGGKMIAMDIRGKNVADVLLELNRNPEDRSDTAEKIDGKHFAEYIEAKKAKEASSVVSQVKLMEAKFISRSTPNSEVPLSTKVQPKNPERRM